MRLVVMQPYLFPYLGYYQLMAAADKFVCYDDVAFINRGWINRNRMLVNGQEYLFTVPLKKASQNKLIYEIELDGFVAWRTKFLRTVEQSYRKAVFFDSTYDLLERIVAEPHTHIGTLIWNSLAEINAYLGLATQLSRSNGAYGNETLKAQERIVDICAQHQADTYINAIGGLTLYNKTDFAANNIDLHFLKPVLKPYKQFSAEFVPGLSMIDVLMHNSIDEVRAMLDDYELV
jgi:hypothetical protein